MKTLTGVLLLILFLAAADKSNDLKAVEPSLYYVIRASQNKSAQPPVIILLHGLGSNEKDLFSFAGQLPARFLVIAARAPYTIGQDSYAWYQLDLSTGKQVMNSLQAEKSRNTIIQFIDQLKTKFHFDDKQVYLCGFSQGAIMSLSVGLTRPDLVKGIAIMSGKILDDVKPLVVANKQLQQLNVFVSHGKNDKIIDVKYAREGESYLEKLNIKPTYKEYDEGHGINNEMLFDLVNWLNKTLK